VTLFSKPRVCFQVALASKPEEVDDGDFERSMALALQSPRVSAVSDATASSDQEAHVPEPVQGDLLTSSLEKEVEDFEAESEKMLGRMDDMLAIVRNISVDPDPSHRLEVTYIFNSHLVSPSLLDLDLESRFE